MTPIQLLTILGVGLLVIGLTGALLRRSWLVVLASLELGLLGVSVLFIAFGAARDDPAGVARGVILLVLAVAYAVVGAAVAVAVFRRRATVNLDELRELRG
jgi:NADH-quinone oxidoreductase subunit K